jgi:hypothetical protein
MCVWPANVQWCIPPSDAVFQNALVTLDSLKSGVLKLHSTLEEMRAQHCFDAADIAITPERAQQGC